jgi:hypothetical protein
MPTEEVMTEKREAEIEGLAAQKSADMQEVFDARRLERGTLTVHTSQTIASYWLPRHLMAFHRAASVAAPGLEAGLPNEAALTRPKRIPCAAPPRAVSQPRCGCPDGADHAQWATGGPIQKQIGSS